MPEGWVKKKLGDVAEIRMCKRIFSEQTTTNGDIPFYKIGTFGKQPDAYISSTLYDEYTRKYSFPSKGDVLLSAAGTLGRTVVYDGKPAYFQDSNIVWLEIDNDQICNEYLNHCYQVVIWPSPEGSTISRLYNSIIRATDINLPPLPEQIAIAEALSDADSLIASLEKLIAKKTVIKQGAMQELLTGKMRLPGFSGEWVDETLSSLCVTITDGSHVSPVEVDQGYYMPSVKDMRYNDFDYSDCKMISETDYDQLVLNGCNPRKGDVVIAKDGSMLKFVFSIKEEVPIVILSSIAILRPNAQKADSEYLAHYFRQPNVIEYTILNYKTGTGVPRIVLENFKRIQMRVPSKKEQAAIAAILSDMDAEIEQLEKKLAKCRLIKQGMMQELLTGRIRLVESAKQTDVIEIAKDKPVSKGHNLKYDDAIAISAIVNAFYDDRFILGRVKVQKLLYLLRRKQDADVSAFKKKAAGPYNEKARYNGGESIAIKEGYIIRQSGKAGSKFSRGMNLGVALQYVGSTQADIDWLLEKFRYFNTNENKDSNNLEVLATVDMAVCELNKTGQAISVDAVKGVIRSNKEWAPKLKKPCFTDAAIQKAIEESEELFG